MASSFWQAPPLFPSYLSNGEVPGGNAGSLKLPAAEDSCKIFVVGAGGKFPGREKIGISQQSTRPVGRNFLGPDFRETPGFVRQKENSYRKARWEIPMNDGGQLLSSERKPQTTPEVARSTGRPPLWVQEIGLVL